MVNLGPPERETEGGRERWNERGGAQGVVGWVWRGSCLPRCAKPAAGTTASIHIQMLPGGRSKEAIDGGMEREGWREGWRGP